MELIILDLDNASEEEFIDAIEKNNRLITTMQKNIDTMQSKASNKTDNNNEVVVPKEKENKIDKENKTNQEIKDEIDYYFSMIDSFPDSDELLSDLITSIPSRKNLNYNNLILGVKLELLREIKEFEELLGNQEEFTKSELQEFLDVINLNKKKIDLLSLIENQEMNEEETQEIENNFIFVPTSGGNIRIIDEISDMPVEYLDGFKGLFDSIKDGTFKNVKRFYSCNNKNAGMSEVRDNKIRIIFDRIARNDYALVTAFIKNSENDKGYLESINLKIKNYIEQRDKIKANLSNPEFKKIHTEYTEELYRILNKEEKQNTQYKKGRGVL